MVWTLSEKIVNAVGTGEDPAELDNLELQSAVLQDLTASAAELNILDGATVTAAELNYLDIATLGTGVVSKAVVLDENGDYTFPSTATLVVPSGGDLTLASGSTLDVAGTFEIANVAMTASAAELNYNDIATLGTGAVSKAVVLDGNGDYTFPATATIVMPSGGTETFNSGATLTVAGTLAITGAVTQTPVFVADATPYTVLAANSGKTHVVLEQANSITINLPVIAAGLYYKFIMGGVAVEAQNWVIVATTPSFYNGGVLWTDLNDAENNVAAVYGNGTSHLTLTVTTPGVGTEIEIFSNGTEWFVHGDVISDSTPAFT